MPSSAGLSPRLRGNPARCIEDLQSMAEYGLSPRLRGNHDRCAAKRLKCRSIPASTGEPPSAPERSLPCRVYPRVYGGTAVSLVSRVIDAGSIPASTGEPKSTGGTDHQQESIPASTGQPRDHTGYSSGENGLSPRLRGNLPADFHFLGIDRSIPASTGEPLSASSRSKKLWVYPRVYGGTAGFWH